MINMRMKHALWMVVSFFLLGSVVHAQQVTASSGFEPSIVRVGEQARYQFTLSSSEVDPRLESLALPEVAGLEMQYTGVQSGREMNLSSGGFQQTIRQTYTFVARAAEAGEYTIPEFELKVAGERLRIPAATLKVLDRGEVAPDGSTQPAVFAELALPRESHYVGEAVLAELKLYVDDDRVMEVSRGSNRFITVKEGDAFRVGEFGQERSQMVEKDGRILREHTWEVMITPLKTGPQPLVMQIDLVVSERESRAPRTRMEQLLGQSMFMNRQRVTLYTDDRDLTILPLPTQGRPVDFTGGIGMFSVDQPRLSAASTMAGEPLTMTLVVRGQGNFDRMQPPVLSNSDVWRDYDPESDFSSADEVGYTGVKTFEYTLIPREAGEFETPEIAFNFFNPDTAKYVELPIPGEKVTVTPNPNAKRPVSTKRNPVAARRGPELLPILTTPGTWVSSIRPIVTNPVFLGMQVVPAIALGFVVLRRRKQLRLENDAAYARRLRAQKNVQAELARAREAVQAKDAPAFYAAAQRGVQEAAGRHVEQIPESLTADDVAEIARQQQLSDEQRQSARVFFEAGDAIRFGGLGGDRIDFSAELARLEQTLSALEGGAR